VRVDGFVDHQFVDYTLGVLGRVEP